MSEHSDAPTENIPGKEALLYIMKKVESWNLSDHSDEENTLFLLHIAHWSLENFGQRYSKTGTYVIDTNFHIGEGFEYVELPEPLKNYAMTDFYGDIYTSNQNDVKLESTYRTDEREPYIPKWDTLSLISPFTDMVAAARKDPEVMAMILPGEFYIDPGVEINYQPGIDFGWGLQFTIFSQGVQVLPYGKYGKTKSALDAALALQASPALLIETALELVMISNKYASWIPPVGTVNLDVLESRLSGASNIDVSDHPIRPNPANSVKYLLLDALMNE